MPTIAHKTRLLFVVVSLLTAFWGYWATHLTYNYDIELLFPQDDPALDLHRAVEAEFAVQQEYLILGIENEEGIYNPTFLQSLDKLVQALEERSEVKAVNSITNLRYYRKGLFGIQSLPFLHPHDPNRYEQDSIFFHAHTDAAPKFIGRNQQSVCNFLFLTGPLDDTSKVSLPAFIAQEIDRHQFDGYHLYGQSLAQQAQVEELESELYWLMLLAGLMIFLVLVITFRSIWGVVIPLTLVVLTVIWTMGTMAISGVAVNVMTVLVPTIVAIISLSDVIHVMNRFREEQGRVMDRGAAIRLAMRDMRAAVLLTSLTTALGFATLSTTSIQPFIQFGIFTIIGVGYAYGFAVLVLPRILAIVPLHIRPLESFRLAQLVRQLFRWTFAHPRTVLSASGVIILLAIGGSAQVQVNGLLYEDRSAQDPLSQSLRFFETEYMGIRSFDLYLTAANAEEGLLDTAVLRELDQLDHYLTQEYGLRDAYSVVTEVKRGHRVLQGGQPEWYTLPQNPTSFNYILGRLRSRQDSMGLQSILSEDGRSGRLKGKSPDWGSAVVWDKNQALQAFIATEIDSTLLQVQLTGSSLLLDRSNELITRQLLWGLLFALLLVALLMGWFYRSWRMMVLALVPNVLPLIMVLGLMGWLDIGLKMSTAVIFTIAFGIAVDDTIHFMSRLYQEIRKGMPRAEALVNTHQSTGTAIVLTSIILILGFGTLIFSSFQATFITGLFISLTLCFAVFADLIVLPVLLQRFWVDEDEVKLPRSRKMAIPVLSTED